MKWGGGGSTEGVHKVCGGGCSGHGKLAKLAHRKAPKKSLGIKDQRCPMLRLSHKAMW